MVIQNKLHIPEVYEAAGAVHLHSTVSDGSLSIPEIAEIANTVDIDFLMFSDHNTLAPKREGLEGWYERVCVLIGYEINDLNDQNHYLAFRISEEVPGLEAHDYVNQVKKGGGFGIIAHPAEKRSFSDAYPAYPWTEWDVEAFDAIEIWNQLSEWMEGVTRMNILYRIWHPLKSIRFPVYEILQRWDRLNRNRRVSGIGGIDVHAYRLRFLGLFPVEIYPYKVQFKSIRTHVLLDKPLTENGSPIPFENAEKMIYDALIQGSSFISNYSLGNARGFRFWASEKDEYHLSGSRLPLNNIYMLHAVIPSEAHIRLLKDSQVIKEVNGSLLEEYVRSPGVYRIEAFRKKRGWIYSNPIVFTE
jgi:hypothetical protein